MSYSLFSPLRFLPKHMLSYDGGANWSYDGGGVSGTLGDAVVGAFLLQFCWLLRIARRQHHSEQDTIRKNTISPPNEAMYHTTDHESKGVESGLPKTKTFS